MNRSVGVDIGHSRVKAIVLQQRSGRLDVIGTEMIPAGTPSEVAQQLRGFLAASKALSCLCELCLSADYWRVRRVELTDRRGLVRHLRDVVRSELEDDLEGGPEQWIVDACPVERDQGAVAALAFAARREQLAVWIDALESVGIRAAGLYPEPICIETGLRAFGKDTIPKHVLVCDLGAASAKVLLLDAGKLRHVAVFAYDATNESLLRTASSQLGLALAARAVAGVPVRLTGGLRDRFRNAVVDGLKSVLSLEDVADLGTDDLLAKLEPEMLCAAGAATKQWDSSEIYVDLRRGALSDQSKTRQVAAPFIAAAILFAMGLGLLGLSLSHQAASAQARVQSDQAEVREIWRQLYPETPVPAFISGRLTSERIRLEGLAGQHGSVPNYRDLLEMLRQAFDHLPGETRLYVASVNLGQDTATLKGEVSSHSVAQQLAEALTASSELATSPPATAQLPNGAVSFDVTLSYRQHGQNDAP